MSPTSSRLRVAALPVPVAYSDPAANLIFVREAFESLPAGTDLVVLPELFTTGFHPKMDMDSCAEESESVTPGELQHLAARYDVAIAGSYLVRKDGGIFNHGFIIMPSGEGAFYDKHHLFTASAEGQILTQGMQTKPVVSFRDWNISLVICYDLRFPAWCRNCGGEYDLLLVPANWPAERGYAWKHLLIARAIENQAAVVGANRAGEDKFGHYDDQTFIFDCKGQPIWRKEGLFIVADLEKEVQNQYRQDFPALSESDSFTFV